MGRSKKINVVPVVTMGAAFAASVGGKIESMRALHAGNPKALACKAESVVVQGFAETCFQSVSDGYLFVNEAYTRYCAWAKKNLDKDEFLSALVSVGYNLVVVYRYDSFSEYAELAIQGVTIKASDAEIIPVKAAKLVGGNDTASSEIVGK